MNKIYAACLMKMKNNLINIIVMNNIAVLPD